MNRTLASSAALVGILLLPSVSEASKLATTFVKNSSVSGHTGTTHTYDFKDAFVTSMHFYEDSDSPCYAAIYAMKWDSDNNYGWEYKEHDQKSCGQKEKSKKWVGSHTVSEIKAIKAIKVCTSVKKKNDSYRNVLKGLEVWYQRVDPETGKLAEMAGTEKFYRPNCKKWHTKVSCPDDTVASGLILESQMYRNSSKRPIRGIGLKCSKVTKPMTRPQEKEEPAMKKMTRPPGR